MDIACPTCAAAYEVDDHSVGDAGRKVRCADCGTIWRTYRGGRSELLSTPPPATAVEATATPTLIDAPPMAPAAEDIAATAELPAAEGDLTAPEIDDLAPDTASPTPPPKARAEIVPGRTKRQKPAGSGIRGLLRPPALTLAASLAMIACAVTWRDAVVRTVPQSAAVFGALGLSVNLRGIEIRNVRSRMVEDNGVNVLVIDGDLINLRAEQTSVPRLRFAVLGDKGQELFAWTAQADRSALKPGETLNFRRRLAAPPGDGKDVTVRFHTVSDITAGLR
jgi:predicted Zn finger-like uncharacterized protein